MNWSRTMKEETDIVDAVHNTPFLKITEGQINLSWVWVCGRKWIKREDKKLLMISECFICCLILRFLISKLKKQGTSEWIRNCFEEKLIIQQSYNYLFLHSFSFIFIYQIIFFIHRLFSLLIQLFFCLSVQLSVN